MSCDIDIYVRLIYNMFTPLLIFTSINIQVLPHAAARAGRLLHPSHAMPSYAGVLTAGWFITQHLPNSDDPIGLCLYA